MRTIKKCGYLGLMIMIFLCCYVTVWGEEIPQIIKVGLESVYKNTSSIMIKSDVQMEVGYYNAYGFSPIGTLEYSSLSISKVTETYYDTGSTYGSFQEAAAAAIGIQGIPAYVQQGMFTVYTINPMGTPVISNGNTYIAKDANGMSVLIWDNAVNEIVFRGYDVASGLHITTVGNSKKYRGAIGIGGTTGITPYNILSIEEYLYGVVPCEMLASWPEEALKAQAVAARSIAIAQYNRFISSGYHVVDTTTTQAYGGYNKEDSRTTAAVNATAGQVIRYNGVVAEALYFSTSGGYTESAVNVWGNAINYLIGVQDLYETEPAQAAWTRNITLSEINQCLASKNISIGSAQGVQIVSRTQSGRVNEMNIIGSNGNYNLKLENIRTFFSATSGGSLKSRLFTLQGSTLGSVPNETKTVTVLSAAGMKEVAWDQIVVTNDKSTGFIAGNNVVIEGQYGKKEVNIAENTTESNGSEIVMGDLVIQGKGFGHGVGMSQSGAKGMAKAGFDYKQILAYYYTGITIG